MHHHRQLLRHLRIGDHRTLQRLWHDRTNRDPNRGYEIPHFMLRISILSFLLMVAGLAFIGIGVFRYTPHNLLHNICAKGLPFVMLLLFVLLPWLAPRLSKAVMVASDLTALVCAAFWVNMMMGHNTLTNVEALAGLAFLGWFIVFSRQIAAIEADRAAAQLLHAQAIEAVLSSRLPHLISRSNPASLRPVNNLFDRFGLMTERLTNLWPAPLATQPLNATVTVPGSKSLSNRYLILAALGSKPVTLIGLLRSRDTDLMMGALEALGVRCDVDSATDTTVTVTPPVSGRSHGNVNVFCGLAGTVMRFVPGLALFADGPVNFDGDEQAYARPMKPCLTVWNSWVQRLITTRGWPSAVHYYAACNLAVCPGAGQHRFVRFFPVHLRPVAD